MAKLDIIIPHYKEDVRLMDQMFGVLRLQRNIKWTDFRVLIVCDGEDIVLPDDFGKNEPFEVKSITVSHRGISGARNAGLDYSQAEWVMWCDSDDAFMSTEALYTYMRHMTDDKVAVFSAFYEEFPSPSAGIKLLRHDGKDYIFVHGKAFRRSWLNDNQIRFNDNLKLHEDSYFIAMAKFHLATKNVAYIKDALYVWQYNPASVSRTYRFFVLETYDQLCKKNSALTDELLRRGMYVHAKGIVCRTITDAYVRLHCKSWNVPGNEQMLADAEDTVALFLRHYDYIFKGAGEKVIQAGLDDMRNKLIKNGDFDEATVIPFEEWVELLRK